MKVQQFSFQKCFPLSLIGVKGKLSHLGISVWIKGPKFNLPNL